MKGSTRRSIACAVAVGAFAALSAASASAATVQLSGVQSGASSGPCHDPSAERSFTMQGSLVGCWYTDTFDSKYQPTSGTYQETGTEHFVGCLDLDSDQACDSGDPNGTLYFTYQFTAKFNPLTLAEIHGRCHHPITGGAGDFTGASGVITFKDDVVTGLSPYRGPLRLSS